MNRTQFPFPFILPTSYFILSPGHPLDGVEDKLVILRRIEDRRREVARVAANAALGGRLGLHAKAVDADPHERAPSGLKPRSLSGHRRPESSRGTGRVRRVPGSPGARTN